MKNEAENIINIVEKYVILLLGVVERPIPSIQHIEKELFILSKFNPKTQKFLRFENDNHSYILRETIEEPFYFEDAFTFDNKGVHLTHNGKQIFNQIIEENKSDKKFIKLINILKLIRDYVEKPESKRSKTRKRSEKDI